MNLIVAVDNKWGIGRDGGLLANIPTDLKYFKEHTGGKVVVMGRKTLESMPGGRGLPNRTNIVLTSQKDFEAERCEVVHSDGELRDAVKGFGSDDVFIIGGSSLYNRYYKDCDRLYITKIDADLDADTFIVNIDEDPDFRAVSVSEPVTENGLTYRFTIYEKTGA